MKMAKRTANTDLNRDNWNDEEETEEAGTFKKASADELKNRVIKKAVRRKPSDAPPASSVFTGFAGFKSTTTTNAFGSSTSTENKPAAAFSFLSKLTSTTDSTSGTKNPPPAMFSFGSTTTTADKKTSSNTDAIVISDDSKSNSSGVSNTSSGKSTEYLSQLKALNQSLLKWITQHVSENPICILSPIFKDYEEHLKKIQENDGKSGGSSNGAAAIKSSPMTFIKPTTSSATAPESTKSDLSNIFKSSSSSSDPPPKSPFAASTDSTTKPLFSFDASKPFTFANVAAPPSSTLLNKTDTNGGGTTTAGDAEDEDEEPPKNEFVPVVEEGSTYSKRCKVFVKKDNAFAERGIGTLYLKPIKDSNKTQLLVRADTNLGNILVNVLLTSAIPAQKKKNNVMLVCLPTPECKPPPTPVLLRVGDETQADELLAEIKKCIPSED